MEKYWQYVEVKWVEGMYEEPRPNGQVLEHREVASSKIGRRMSPAEVVHHVDELKTNNDPSNLVVFSTQADHNRFHHGGTLVDNGDGTFTCSSNLEVIKCLCGKIMDHKHRVCMDCHLKRISERIPNKEELQSLVWEVPSVQIGPMFGVSDRMIGKWCEKYGISKPPRGYWSKMKSKAAS